MKKVTNMPATVLSGARIFLVDDHPAVREGLARLLKSKKAIICGVAENCAQTLGQLTEAAPDLVVVDLSLGMENGCDLISELTSRAIKSLVYSMHDDPGYIQAALDCGASGYVTKREFAATLTDAVHEVLAGRRYLSPLVVQALSGALGQCPLPLHRLSTREREIFQRLGAGDTTAELAQHFGIKPSSVETYYERIVAKLVCKGIKQMRQLAIRYIRGHE